MSGRLDLPAALSYFQIPSNISDTAKSPLVSANQLFCLPYFSLHPRWVALLHLDEPISMVVLCGYLASSSVSEMSLYRGFLSGSGLDGLWGRRGVDFDEGSPPFCASV